MAFAEIELARVKKVVGEFCDSRTNPEIRDKLRYEYSVQRHDVVIHEVRPHWRESGRDTRTGVAKFRFVRSAGEWRLFWMRQDLKWHAYEPCPGARGVEELVEVVDRDEFGASLGEGHMTSMLAPAEQCRLPSDQDGALRMVRAD